MTHTAAPGDTMRVMAKDVAQLDNANVAQPVMTGLTATFSLRNWETGALVSGPHTMTGNSNDDWWLDIAAPAAGRYRIEMTLTKSGATRILHGELKISDPPT